MRTLGFWVAYAVISIKQYWADCITEAETVRPKIHYTRQQEERGHKHLKRFRIGAKRDATEQYVGSCEYMPTCCGVIQ